MLVKFNCPKCHCIEVSEIVERVDKPLAMPEPPICKKEGHWAEAAYLVKLRQYELDHWNESITCQLCGSTITYYK
jgi:hypothetical protein